MPATCIPPLSRKFFRHPEGEWEVYKALRDGLEPEWFLLAEFEGRLKETQNVHEMDLLLVHEDAGMILIEVKSYDMEVSGGKFTRNWGDPRRFNPLKQLRDQHQTIADRLDKYIPEIWHKIRQVVATPRLIERVGELPDGWVDAQLLDADYLLDIPSWIKEISLVGSNMRLGAANTSMVIRKLGPNTELNYSPEGLRRISRANMERQLESETEVLQTLDLNHRALVIGGAGSGKTMLAHGWVHRALGRKERVLFTCYNDPLAREIRSGLVDQNSKLVVASFLRYVEQQLDRTPNINRDRNMQEYWDTLVEDAWEQPEKFTQKFDTIVVDEAQDFEENWYPILQLMLDDGGANRILMVADPQQNVRGMRVGPLPDEPSWALAKLENNYRNSASIARFMSRRFDGAADAEIHEPLESDVPILKVPNADDRAFVAKVREAICDDSTYPETWVLTTNRSSRDLLKNELDLVPWEHRHEGTTCETVRRVKGLEVSRVILAAYGSPDQIDDNLAQLLYAGVSRAVDKLIIVADPNYRKALRST